MSFQHSSRRLTHCADSRPERCSRYLPALLLGCADHARRWLQHQRSMGSESRSAGETDTIATNCAWRHHAFSRPGMDWRATDQRSRDIASVPLSMSVLWHPVSASSGDIPTGEACYTLSTVCARADILVGRDDGLSGAWSGLAAVGQYQLCRRRVACSGSSSGEAVIVR